MSGPTLSWASPENSSPAHEATGARQPFSLATLRDLGRHKDCSVSVGLRADPQTTKPGPPLSAVAPAFSPTRGLAFRQHSVVEVLRRTSNNYGVVQGISRLMRQLDWQGRAAPAPRVAYQPHKLSQRLSDETVADILAAYHAGATTREVGKRFGVAHSSVNKLLKQHGVTPRRRSPSPDELQRAAELYEAGLSTRVIAEHLGFGASTILRALSKAGVVIRPRFGR
jgi:transposase-like protein